MLRLRPAMNLFIVGGTASYRGGSVTFLKSMSSSTLIAPIRRYFLQEMSVLKTFIRSNGPIFVPVIYGQRLHGLPQKPVGSMSPYLVLGTPHPLCVASEGYNSGGDPFDCGNSRVPLSPPTV